MYSTNNGDVNLNVGLDTGSAKKDALQLAKSIVDTFKGADKSIQSQSSSMQSLENRIAKTSDKLADLRNKQTELSKQQIPTEQYTTLSNTIAKLEGQLEKLGNKSIQLQNGAQTNRTKKQLDDIEKEAERLQSQLTYSEEALQNLVNSGKAFTLGTDTEAYSKISQQIGYTEGEMEVLNLKHDEMIAKQNKEVSGAERLMSAFSKVRGTVSRITDGMKKLASAGKKSFDNINKSTKRGIFTLLKYTLGIRSLFILFRRLRSTATEALKAMGQKFPEVQKDLNNLKSAFTGFKASIGTAFQPLLAAAVPVLVTIINLATKAANAIGSLFAALTGQDYVYKATAANNDYTDSISGVGKAAKEANKQLGEYDELMLIQSDNDSGGSGGGGGAAGSGMDWEKVPVENSIKDLANRIKQAWKDADFTDIGKELGTKIKDKLDNIKWDELKETAEKAGKSLATFLNGFFQSGVLASTGTAISEALNTAIRGALGFVNNFEWGQNGIEFGKMFNNLVKYFDEHAFAELIANTIKGALDFVTGFFTEADFKALGQKIGSFLSDLTMEIPEVTVKIVKLAWTIAKDAAGFVAGVNETNPFLVDLMAMLGIAKLGAVPGLQIPLLTIAIAKIGWDLGHTIYDNLPKDAFGNNVIDKFVEATGLGQLALNIADTFDEIASNGIKGFWEGLKSGATGIFESIKGWVRDYIIEPWKEVLGIHSPSTVLAEIGGNVIEGFKQGILNAITGIQEWLSTNVVTPILNGMAAVKEITATIKGKIDETFNTMKATWDNLSTAAKDLWANVKGKVEDTFTNLKNAWDNLVTTTKELIAEGKAKGIEAINKLGDAWNILKSSVATITKKAVGKASGKNAITSITSAWKKLLNTKATQTLTAKFRDMFTGPLKSVWNALANKVNDAIVLINKIPGVNITGRVPKLAQGAVIPPNKEFMAILGDQKQGVNIETPLATMVEAFNKALDMRGNSDSNREPIVLQLDGRDIVRLVWDEQDKRYKQTGKYTPRYS